MSAEAHIRSKVRMVVADENLFGVLSTGERIAVAFVLDRHDLIKRAWGTIAEAVHRLGLNGRTPRCAFNVTVGTKSPLPSPQSSPRHIEAPKSLAAAPGT